MCENLDLFTNVFQNVSVTNVWNGESIVETLQLGLVGFPHEFRINLELEFKLIDLISIYLKYVCQKQIKNFACKNNSNFNSKKEFENRTKSKQISNKKKISF